MDKIFGHTNLLNEIIWHYKSFHGNVRRYFPRKHDTFLLYSIGLNMIDDGGVGDSTGSDDLVWRDGQQKAKPSSSATHVAVVGKN